MMAKSIQNGDRHVLSRAITLLESRLPADQLLVSDLFSALAEKGTHKPAIRLGFSGAPGVGKSTLIERFGMFLVNDQQKHLAVLVALDAGYDIVVVETVGVGQSELAVMDLVDMFILLVAPGIGDELQGITEMADIILVNKADDPLDKGANQTLFEYKSAMKYALGGKSKKVLLSVSTDLSGAAYFGEEWKRHFRGLGGHPRAHRVSPSTPSQEPGPSYFRQSLTGGIFRNPNGSRASLNKSFSQETKFVMLTMHTEEEVNNLNDTDVHTEIPTKPLPQKEDVQPVLEAELVQETVTTIVETVVVESNSVPETSEQSAAGVAVLETAAENTESAAGVEASAVDAGAEDKSPALVKEQLRYCATVLKGLKRHPQSPPFQAPVDPLALNIPDYFDIIKNPMDLSLVSKKLEAGEYADADSFIADIRLMLQNCFSYNHPDSQVSKMGHSLEKYFNTAIGKLPTSLPLPGEDDKKRSTSTPLSATRARRESHAPHRLANAVGSSTPRSRARSTSNPELAFCNNVLKELTKKAHLAIAWPFLEPVDPAKLGIPDYYDVIKQPMDLSTVRRKLEAGQYTTAEQFEGDVRLIFSNCYSYNAPDSDVVSLCRAFEKLFDSKWAQKPAQWGYAGSSYDDVDSDSEKILEINRQIQALQQELNTLLMKRRNRSSSMTAGATPRPKKASRPASKPGSAPITEEEFLSRPMSFEEKRQLSIEVNNLPPEKLGRVVEIIQAGMALEAQGDSDVIELDIESLNVRTLRQLQRYVMECKGITSLAAILGETGASAKRKKPSTGGSGTKKPTVGGGPTPAAAAATAAAGAMSSEEEESSDEDLD
ncbi:Bromo domain-containing protein [Paramicrosporidium saccamoebae]|uniref:Bromo domain-containing protein n=1 Tax=Paramicrosporidium saccamoebae TaxID=1246581 RepID=A0A2H9TL63_9FUNG|nr:Bromo domain-containing protein [Paramicrosporidium saccamoebae]